MLQMSHVQIVIRVPSVKYRDISSLIKKATSLTLIGKVKTVLA